MLDGEVVPVKSFEDVHRLLGKVFSGIALGPNTSFHTLRREHGLKVGDATEIVAFDVLNPPADFEEEIKRISLRICHESLYGETEVYDTRNHQ